MLKAIIYQEAGLFQNLLLSAQPENGNRGTLLGIMQESKSKQKLRNHTLLS